MYILSSSFYKLNIVQHREVSYYYMPGEKAWRVTRAWIPYLQELEVVKLEKLWNDTINSRLFNIALLCIRLSSRYDLATCTSARC